MNTNINADAEKDPDELEREVDQQRAYIDETLRALEQRFSPGQIFDEVLRYTRSNSGDFSRNLVDTIKTNPVPTLLTATGLMWMMYGQNHSQNRLSGGSQGDFPPSNASYGVDPAYDTSGGDGRTAAMKDKANQLREGASETFGKTKERMQHLGGSAQQSRGSARARAHDARDNMRHSAERANQGFQRMLKEQPLALGAIGIALGAMAGASMPQSRRENELMGQTRDQVVKRAQETAEETASKASDVGQRVAEDAKQEVQSTRQPSTPH